MLPQSDDALARPVEPAMVLPRLPQVLLVMSVPLYLGYDQAWAFSDWLHLRGPIQLGNSDLRCRAIAATVAACCFP